MVNYSSILFPGTARSLASQAGAVTGRKLLRPCKPELRCALMSIDLGRGGDRHVLGGILDGEPVGAHLVPLE